MRIYSSVAIILFSSYGAGYAEEIVIENISSYPESIEISANFLADLGVIEYKKKGSDYYPGWNITRREMLKVMMNMSEKDISMKCGGKFADLDSSDWGCKYAEAALKNGFIVPNKNFRPDVFVTQIEALKMIMQARGIERDANVDWKEGYASKARSERIAYLNFGFDTNVVRGVVFDTAAKTYPEFVNRVLIDISDIKLSIIDYSLFISTYTKRNRNYDSFNQRYELNL